MKALIQRVKHASVTTDGEIYSRIGNGILVLLGVVKGDEKNNAENLAQKLINFRIFKDENGKMNKSLLDVKGEMLIVSQFTLCADCKKGSRPSFENSAPPGIANELYEYFISKVKEANVPVKTGKFGAMMDVELINDGPVTFMIEK